MYDMLVNEKIGNKSIWYFDSRFFVMDGKENEIIGVTLNPYTIDIRKHDGTIALKVPVENIVKYETTKK